MDADARFDDLVARFLQQPGVAPPSPGRGFGSSALRVDGRIFAMLVRGRLVVKLPASRVDEVVAAGDGEHFDANKGTPMKEWLALHPASSVEWEPLASDALRFVRGR